MKSCKKAGSRPEGQTWARTGGQNAMKNKFNDFPEFEEDCQDPEIQRERLHPKTSYGATKFTQLENSYTMPLFASLIRIAESFPS